MRRKINKRYVPKSLSKKDRKRQILSIKKSQKLYKKHIYISRAKVKSFKSRKSSHVTNARNVYKTNKIKPSKKLAKKTLCSLSALKKIVRKGEGAYYSSGSRPNQTAQSWGYARLASAITGGKASVVDYKILKSGCKKNSRALKLANKRMKEHGGKLRKAIKTTYSL